MDKADFLRSIDVCFKFIYKGSEYFVKSCDVYKNGIAMVIIRYVDYKKASEFYEMYVSREEGLSEEEIKEALSVSPFRGILDVKSVAVNGNLFDKISKTSGVYIKNASENKRSNNIIEKCSISNTEKLSLEYTTIFIKTDGFCFENINDLSIETEENKFGEKIKAAIKDCKKGSVFRTKNHNGNEYVLTVAEKMLMKPKFQHDCGNLIENMDIDETMKNYIENGVIIGFDILPCLSDNDKLTYIQNDNNITAEIKMINIGFVFSDIKQDSGSFKTLYACECGQNWDFEICIMTSVKEKIRCVNA